MEARRVPAGIAHYAIVEIPPLEGDASASAWDINEHDQVVGASFHDGRAVPFLWEPGRGSRRLLDLQGSAVALNENGDVVATWTSACDGQISHAVSARTDGGTFHDLGSLGDPEGSCTAPHWTEPYAINRSGVIVGCSQRLDGPIRAFQYAGGQMVELPTQGGPARRSCATPINDRGQIAGQQFAGGGPGFPFGTHAFLFEDGRMTDIGAGFVLVSMAKDINNHGQVAGDVLIEYDDQPGGVGALYHAFLYDQGVTRDLGGFDGRSTRVLAMNDRGQIVGAADRTAFLWENGQFYDLRALVGDPSVTFFEARAINDQGHIVVSGRRGDGPEALMLLLPASSGPLVAVASFDSSRAEGYAPLWEGLDGTRSYTTDPSTWIADCHWTFGDGTPDQHSCWALHVYSQTGAYTATLTVTDNLGRTASSSLAITARRNPGPVPVVEYGPASGAAPHAVFMDGTRSYAVRENSWVATCRWDFGDGSAPDTRCWALHTYQRPGHYTARFTVTDEQGVSSMEALDIDAF